MIYQLMSMRTQILEMRLGSIFKIALRLAFPVKMSKDLSPHFAQLIPPLSPLCSLIHFYLTTPLLEEDIGLVRALELISKFIPLKF